jgi:hypothetical protein
MLSALDAILGHKSHTALQLTLCGRPLHITSVVYYAYYMISQSSPTIKEHTAFLWDDFPGWISIVGCTFYLSFCLPFLNVAITTPHIQQQEACLAGPSSSWWTVAQNFSSCVVSTVDFPGSPREIQNFATENSHCHHWRYFELGKKALLS